MKADESSNGWIWSLIIGAGLLVAGFFLFRKPVPC